jgi:basic membrane protein A
MLKKRLSLLVAILAVLVLLLAACGGQTSEPAAETDSAGEAPAESADSGDCSSDEVLCIGLVTDVGEIDDKSFNQSAWEGVQQAEKELGAQIDFIETQDAKDYLRTLACLPPMVMTSL